MHAARTPAHRADVPRPTRHQRGHPPPARGPAGLDAHPPPDEELLARFGDAIDDRIADILDELLAERSSAHQHRRLPYLLGVVSLILVGLLLVITALIATR